MIYDIHLVTSATYQGSAPFARHVLRLLPSVRPGLDVQSATLAIEPQPAEQIEGQDFFGNTNVWATIETAHTRLVVRVSARVGVNPEPAPDPDATPAWERVAEAALAVMSLAPEAPAHFVFPSRHVVLADAIGAYARESFAPGRPILAAALDLTRRMHGEFSYVAGVTTVATPASEAFAARRGVCQDFAHVMIAGLRWLGLPCAYVSGCLRTLPLPGGERLEGVDQTHAWVRVWCGPDAGWIGLDPTNGVIAGADHVILALGRDYGDVAPLDGVVFTHGKQTLDVAVDVVPAP